MSSLRVHGSVTLDGRGGHMITFEIAGFGDRQAAQIVNREIAKLLEFYLKQRLAGVVKEHGDGIPPWKQQ
ncbi:hypothetical protein EHM76_00275 [bacterium]|nr:MAG: hypothetical protein EHM84_06825 [Xanthomonadales bacterium]RPH76022.1 MAG: hypothetical protein EHM76_00275 [bacterium]